MIEYIKGTITQITPTFVTIESGGIGYFVNISINTFSKLEGKIDFKIFIHEVIREDTHQLFGFADTSEREIFRLLISVSGVGANTARMMLSSLSPVEIEKAILGSDVNLLKSVKGIGLKTAQRIIDYRKQIRKFTNVNQLLNVSGIGNSKLNKIKKFVYLN